MREDHPHLVYFIKPVGWLGPVKIGCSRWPASRLVDLAMWSPVPLEVAVTIEGGFKLERNIHDCFHDQRSHYEWFHASERLTQLIYALKAGVPIGEALDLSDRRRMRVAA